MNNLALVCYGIILLNIPIYLLLRKRAFSVYLSVLFLGSVAQRIGTSMLWQHDQATATLFYESCAVIIELSLIAFILIKYFDIHLLSEKRFHIFMLTTTVGLGAKALFKSATVIEIENIVLIFMVLTLLLSVSYFRLQFYLKKSLRLDIDRLVLLSIFLASAIYLSTYLFVANKSMFYLSQSILWIVQATFWLFCGTVFLLKEKKVSPWSMLKHF